MGRLGGVGDEHSIVHTFYQYGGVFTCIAIRVLQAKTVNTTHVTCFRGKMRSLNPRRIIFLPSFVVFKFQVSNKQLTPSTCIDLRTVSIKTVDTTPELTVGTTRRKRLFSCPLRHLAPPAQIRFHQPCWCTSMLYLSSFGLSLHVLIL